jgi:hypothetical protein
VHALRRIHRGLVRSGELVDIHPVPPNAAVLAAEGELGRLNERGFFETVRVTEAGLARLVDEGLFRSEAETEFDWIERYDRSDELFEAVADWEGIRIPWRLRRRIRRTAPPLDIRERVVVRRLRAQ